MRTQHEIEIDRIHDAQLADKDVEIEQLKGELEQIKHSILFETWGHSKKLISELADALESSCLELSWDALPEIEKHRLDLVQRAREATE